MLVVGGDSGGTRLADVRFLAVDRPGADWEKVADLQTARWGRPSVGTIGGKITGRTVTTRYSAPHCTRLS